MVQTSITAILPMVGAVYTGDDTGRVVSEVICPLLALQVANAKFSMSGIARLLTEIRKGQQDGRGGERP